MTDRNAAFSLVAFAVALVTVSLGTAAGLAFVPVVGTYVGTLAGAFAAGLAVEKRPVLEGGVAGVLAGLGVLAAGPFVGNGVVAAITALGSISPVTLLVSAALSFAVGAFGAHFGDDLRDGLTEPVESASGPTDIGSVGVPPMTESAEETKAVSADRRSGTGEAVRRQSETPDSAGGRSETDESTELELE